MAFQGLVSKKARFPAATMNPPESTGISVRLFGCVPLYMSDQWEVGRDEPGAL